MYCRFCNSELKHKFLSLGATPLSNSFLTEADLCKMEPYYPLEAYVCDRCFLIQLNEFESPENIFSNYAYFSSYSNSWLEHCRDYAEMITDFLQLNRKSQVIEIASNDGYLLQYFVEKDIPVLGIEPASNVARAARERGIPTTELFFGTKTAKKMAAAGVNADLLIGNNVLAHVPDLNDFVAGLKIILKPHGVITLEFPHVMRLIEGNQFDTIYHEHFSYFSFITVQKVFAAHCLEIFDVEELSTHGGSLRVYVHHREDESRNVSAEVNELEQREIAAGFSDLDFYMSFAPKIEKLKRNILSFLINARNNGKIIGAYGAPAKGNTLLNYCGVNTDFIDFTVDRSPHKQGLYLPGTHIPIYEPDKIRQEKPDYVIILPWNLKDEIAGQISYIREWKGQFVTLIPEVRVF